MTTAELATALEAAVRDDPSRIDELLVRFRAAGGKASDATGILSEFLERYADGDPRYDLLLDWLDVTTGFISSSSLIWSRDELEAERRGHGG